MFSAPRPSTLHAKCASVKGSAPASAFPLEMALKLVASSSSGPHFLTSSLLLPVRVLHSAFFYICTLQLERLPLQHRVGPSSLQRFVLRITRAAGKSAGQEPETGPPQRGQIISAEGWRRSTFFRRNAAFQTDRRVSFETLVTWNSLPF